MHSSNRERKPSVLIRESSAHEGEDHTNLLDPESSIRRPSVSKMHASLETANINRIIEALDALIKQSSQIFDWAVQGKRAKHSVSSPYGTEATFASSWQIRSKRSSSKNAP
jgi:hypothetical protein